MKIFFTSQQQTLNEKNVFVEKNFIHMKIFYTGSKLPEQYDRISQADRNELINNLRASKVIKQESDLANFEIRLEVYRIAVHDMLKKVKDREEHVDDGNEKHNTVVELILIGKDAKYIVHISYFA